jgi:hypothetical protein
VFGSVDRPLAKRAECMMDGLLGGAGTVGGRLSSASVCSTSSWRTESSPRRWRAHLEALGFSAKITVEALRRHPLCPLSTEASPLIPALETARHDRLAAHRRLAMHRKGGRHA